MQARLILKFTGALRKKRLLIQIIVYNWWCFCHFSQPNQTCFHLKQLCSIFNLTTERYSLAMQIALFQKKKYFILVASFISSNYQIGTTKQMVLFILVKKHYWYSIRLKLSNRFAVSLLLISYRTCRGPWKWRINTMASWILK